MFNERAVEGALFRKKLLVFKKWKVAGGVRGAL